MHFGQEFDTQRSNLLPIPPYFSVSRLIYSLLVRGLSHVTGRGRLWLPAASNEPRPSLSIRGCEQLMPSPLAHASLASLLLFLAFNSYFSRYFSYFFLSLCYLYPV